MARILTDQMDHKITLPEAPLRIVSLVPSQTELLFELGLDEEVVGITKFCVHPAEQFRRKPRVGGTKKVKLEKIRALSPNLIIGNKEENTEWDIRRLQEEYPVWMSDIHNLEDALSMIRSVGLITGREAAAEQLAGQIRRAFSTMRQAVSNQPPLRAAYVIWRKPYMVAASQTFIHHMMQQAGFTNAFAQRERYPEITLEELMQQQPEVLLLSSEPYPFREKHLEEFRIACPAAQVELVDGELFSWYGSRLLKSPPYFQELRERLMASA
jgi:ABC-type Fe3+-hydroxamate transport system substrate-binding protein